MERASAELLPELAGDFGAVLLEVPPIEEKKAGC